MILLNYCVDYENVNQHGVELVNDRALPQDDVFLFFTDNAHEISMKKLADCCGNLHFVKVKTGKESLDRHLLVQLGFLLCEYGKECKNYIVSNDTGFDPVMEHWRTKGYKLERLPVDLKGTQKEVIQPLSENTVLNSKLMKHLKDSGLSSEQFGKVVSYTIKNKREKMTIYRWLIHTYGQKRGLKVYRLISSEI